MPSPRSRDRATPWPRDRFLRWGLRAWAGVGILLLVEMLGGLVGHLRALLVPVLVAGVVVYLLNPIVSAMRRGGLPRLLGAVLTYLSALLLLAGAGLWLAPLLVAQVEAAVDALPRNLDDAGRQVEALAERFGAEVEVDLAGDEVRAWLIDNREAILGSLTGLGSVTASFLSALAVILVGAFAAFYVLVDLPRLGGTCLALVPPQHREATVQIASEVSATVGAFLRGQLVVATFVGAATTLAMWLIGLPLWLFVGVVAGVTNLVPFVGPFIGGALAVLIALANGEPWLALWAALAIVVVQQLESQVVSPLVMGRSVQLHPAVIILAIVLGGSLAGLVGLLVAVPVAASARVVFLHVWRHESRYADDLERLPEDADAENAGGADAGSAEAAAGASGGAAGEADEAEGSAADRRAVDRAPAGGSS